MEHLLNVLKLDLRMVPDSPASHAEWEPTLLWKHANSTWPMRISQAVSRDPSAARPVTSRYDNKNVIFSLKLIIFHLLRVIAAAGSPCARAVAWPLRQLFSSIAVSMEIKRMSTSLIGWQGQKLRGLHNFRRWHFTAGTSCLYR